MRRLSYEGRFDCLLIDSASISAPLPAAGTLDFRDKDGEGLSDVSRLDTMVKVAAVNLLQNCTSQDFLRDRGETMGDGDGRRLVDLLVEPIEFADVVILNKLADADPKAYGCCAPDHPAAQR